MADELPPTTQRSTLKRASASDSIRNSLMNTPLWLPLATAALAILVFDVVIPHSSSGSEALPELVGLVIAGVSIGLAVERWRGNARRRTLLRSLTSTGAVNHLTPMELHDLTISALLKRGWHLTEGATGLPGDAVVMTADRVKRGIFFVQTAGPVDTNTVRRLQASVDGQARPLVITAGSFSPEAIVFARQIGVELVDAGGVLALMSELRGESHGIGPLPAPTFVWEDETLPGHRHPVSATAYALPHYPPGTTLPGMPPADAQHPPSGPAAPAPPPAADAPQVHFPAGTTLPGMAPEKPAPLTAAPAGDAPDPATARCPECSGPMEYHENSSTRYLACSRFPACTGLTVLR